MYPTVAMQCPAHDVLAAATSNKLQCVIFPVGGVVEGDDLAPNRDTRRLKDFKVEHVPGTTV